MRSATMSRRRAPNFVAAGAPVAALPLPATAVARIVRLTLPWLAPGSSTFPLVSRKKAFSGKRGIDIQISRRYGSLPVAQALVISAPRVLIVAEGLPLRQARPSTAMP
jgi:NitT/TauT family transport system substrate-binding protein